MIHLSNIDKFYDSKFQRTFVLKGINLEVNEGEFVSIMGPSGSGKSTLLNIVGLLDAPSAGEYLLSGQPAVNLKEKQVVDYHRNFMGFIFQAYHLIEEMTVYENIETPLIYKGVKSRDRQAMVADLLDRFNMVAKKELFPQQLSGGQQQLVGIARSIVGKPKLLLADEPTGMKSNPDSFMAFIYIEHHFGYHWPNNHTSGLKAKFSFTRFQHLYAIVNIKEK